MSKPLPPLENLKVTWDFCKTQEDQKKSLVDDLFAYINDLSNKLSDADSELEDKRDAIKKVREDLGITKKEIQALKHEKARHAFACVVIDGDSMPFNDDLVQQGLDGGKKTVCLLKEAIETEMKISVPDLAPHMKVVIRIFANLEGLTSTYKRLGITTESNLSSFVRGFNMGDALSDFVDAGNGKECTDEKVKAMSRLHLDDAHCQRIIFGGSTDRGYARLLGPYAENETIRGRITLLEGPPFASELADIKHRFRTISFDHIFRSRKLPDLKRRVSFHVTPPTTPSGSYASVVANPHAVTRSSDLLTLTGVLRNRHGQRIDPPSKFSSQELLPIKQRKLCNHAHLWGKCYYFDTYGQCSHHHSKTSLTPRQMEMLRVVARLSPCAQGSDCDDPACMFGHHCTRNDCEPSHCWYGADKHNIDTRVVT